MMSFLCDPSNASKSMKHSATGRRSVEPRSGFVAWAADLHYSHRRLETAAADA